MLTLPSYLNLKGETCEFKPTVFRLQIKHMMAFIEQETNERVQEIDAKVRLAPASVTRNGPGLLFAGRGRVQH